MKMFQFPQAFPQGFLPAEGMLESSMPTCRIKQLVAKQSAEVVLLADHMMFGRHALTKAIDISQVHTIATDDRTPEAGVIRLKSMGKKVHIASTGKQSTHRKKTSQKT